MSNAVIDQTTFDNLKDMVGEDFIGELVETFFEEGPKLLQEMRQALDDGDADTLRRSAHSLKSNSASFGATIMAAQARELEFLARDGKLMDAQEKMPGFEDAYEQAVEALKALL